MKITFLGTGTSQGVPVIAGNHADIDLNNKKNWRTRSSVHIEIGKLNIQVDAAPEFRLQCLWNNITKLDYFFLTHGHADHILGMDDLRRFCDLKKDNIIPVYTDEYGIERIEHIFPYALHDKPVERGYPCFKLMNMPKELTLENGTKVYSTPLPHGKIKTLGFVFEREGKKIAYYNDCKSLTTEAIELAKNADILILDALKPTLHSAHMSIYEAIEYAILLKAKKTFFTHTTAHIDYDTWENQLPKNCHLAYDGLVIGT